jgi:AcrR family transcriptional regulator
MSDQVTRGPDRSAVPSDRGEATALRSATEATADTATAAPEQALPPSIALAWGRAERPRRGPKPGLSLERIVAAGIGLAVTDGLGSVSMGRVAAELGASTMALYRYVPAKDDLLTLMVDTAFGPAPGAAEPGDGWRAGLARWAAGLRAAYQRHPWVLRVPLSGELLLCPNNIAWMEDALQCLAGTPLPEQQKLSAILLVSGFVRNQATLTDDITAGAGGEPGIPGLGAAMSALIGPDGYPALRQAIASGALDDDSGIHDEFIFGLTRILDGLDVLIRSAVVD